VLHNTAVAEYVEGGEREPQKLLSTLEALKQRLEDARTEAEFGEGGEAPLGDADPSLTAYNIAVLLYQLKQYARCRTILEDMFSNIEPIDEFLALKLCFLLLDVYLLQRQTDRATEVLAYVEKAFAALTKADGKENGGEGGEVAAVDGKGASDWPNKRSTRRPPTTISPDEVRSALSLYKAKLALMSRASKSSKREIKTTLNACAQNTTGLFLKCNLEWQRQNFRKAIKLLNNSCQTTERDANIPALYFNNMGCIHHCMRRHQSAAFYFTRALQENEALYRKPSDGRGISLPTFSCDRRCELEYNRGLQLLLSGRPVAAFDSFMVALQLLHSQPRIWLRLGEACVAHHLQQQSEEQRTSGLASVSPLVQSLAHGSRDGGPAATGSSSRYLVLPTAGPAAAGKGESPGPVVDDLAAAAAEGATASTTGAPAPPSPTLSFGVKCLRNALIQCSVQLGAHQLSSVTAAEYANLLQSSANGSLSASDEQAMQHHAVQRLALLHLSWSALEIDDYVPALSWALQLLGVEACPGSLKMYAHLYACDALCHLNRVDEALEQLTAALELGETQTLAPVASSTGADGVNADGGEGGIENVRNPYSPFSALPAGGSGASGGARATLYTNLAVVHVLQGNTKQAEECCQQALSQQPDCRQALLCSVYLSLQRGQTEAALDLLKKQRRPK
jgi:CCR4-NOT transcription complex subunit 10